MHINKKKILLYKIKACAKQYDYNLNNQNLLFIIKNTNNQIQYLQVKFTPSTFQHLTGCYEVVKGKRMPAYKFYKDCINDRIQAQNLFIENSFVFEKLEVLPQLIQVDKIARMVGDYFDGYGILLETEKIAGTVNCCIGFVIDQYNYYVPNTSLKIDIRKVTNKRAIVKAVLKKKIKDSLYKNVTYLISNVETLKILNNKLIDVEKLYSNNYKINERIVKLKLSLK